MILNGHIVNYDSKTVYIAAKCDDVSEVMLKCAKSCEVRIDDGRHITNAQRRKARAIINDICNWAGYDIKIESQNVHEILKGYFCEEWNQDEFSLSNTDITTARKYINYLILFCLKNDVPCIDALLNRTDDIDAYMYACMLYRKCSICGIPAELHHVDTIGMGNNRKKVEHVGRLAMCLCGKHHEEAHKIGMTEFNSKYHIYPIMLDEALVKKLGL